MPSAGSGYFCSMYLRKMQQEGFGWQWGYACASCALQHMHQSAVVCYHAAPLLAAGSILTGQILSAASIMWAWWAAEGHLSYDSIAQ